MSRRPYRVELTPKGERRSAAFYLVKDVKVGQHKSKVRKYIGTEVPSASEVERLRRECAPVMELKAAVKKAELTAGAIRTQYLSSKASLLVEQVKSVYNSVADLLTVNEIEAYERDFEILYVQGTTSIEGNTLSLAQATDLWLHGIVPRGKSLREINEVQNFKRVIIYRDSYRRKVTPDFVRNLHALVMENIDVEAAGQFRRRDDIGIAGCELAVTPASLVELELRSALEGFYSRVASGWSPFEEAVLFHYRFEMIHPFTDGNGRVGREILNFMLMRARYPRLLFLGKDRDRYIGALKRGNDDDLVALTSTFADLIVAQRLRVLETRLREVAPGIRKSGQMRLTDFVQV